MGNPSIFESRYGRVSCSAREVFEFVTDIRNFEQFVPKNTVNNWNAEKDSCHFTVPMLGTVTVRLSEKKEFIKVVFDGDALQKNDFLLTLNINDNLLEPADINLVLSADLNPMMKMVAVNPINQFLEMLVGEMEKFRGWKETNG